MNHVSFIGLLFHNTKLSGLNYIFILSFSAWFAMEIRQCLCICLLCDESHLRNHELTGNFKHNWQGARDFKGFMFLKKNNTKKNNTKKKVQQKKGTKCTMTPTSIRLQTS